MHRRLWPRAHRFRYRSFWLLLDLEDFGRLSRHLWPLSYNRFNLFSVHDRDHGDGSAVPLLDQAMRHLRRAGIELDGGKVRLLCMPRILGYGFNPISIYFCERADRTLAAIIYEVHNTFAERHSYLIPVRSQPHTIHQHCAKEFYVSPFLEMDLKYEFSVRAPAQNIAVAIRASQSNRPVMTACLSGTHKPLSNAALVSAFLKFPAQTLKVMAAIHWEALRLWLKGLRLRPRPAAPANPITSVPAILEQTD